MSEVPSSHADLLDRPLLATLTTHQADGRLQSTVVWFGRDTDDVLVSTMAEFQKARNMSARPWATVLIVAPEGSRRWVELRCKVAADHGDATALLDTLSLRYTGAAPYFGGCVPAHLAEAEHPVTFRLTPVAVVTGPKPPGVPIGGPLPPARLPRLAAAPPPLRPSRAGRRHPVGTPTRSRCPTTTTTCSTAPCWQR